MTTKTTRSLKDKSCQTCNKNTPKLGRIEANQLLKELDDWQLANDGNSIKREYEVKDFAAGIKFLREIAEVAEKEDHHPDLHLTNYRDVSIELTTHAIDGLSENDFILAAKIDALPVALKKSRQ
jgi:4a-hydroxytetrahydrobiopterin dehydratase